MYDAFAAALDVWPRDGLPDNARAWLVSTGRFKAIDRLRRSARFDAALAGLAEQIEASEPPAPDISEGVDGVEDDRLRLIFTCCHPALSADARIALTLREVCGLETEQIARAFLTARADAGPAHRARQGQDPRRAYPVSGAGSRRAARSPRRRAARRLSRLQRGLFRVGRRRVDPARPVRRSDPPRAAAHRAAAGAGGPRPARVDAAARCKAGRAHIPGRRDRPARCTGSRRSGTAGRSPRASASFERALVVAPARAATRCRRRSRPSTPRRATAQSTDWPQIAGLYDVLFESTRRRSWSSIEPSRWRCATVHRPVSTLVDGDPRARRSRGLSLRTFGESRSSAAGSDSRPKPSPRTGARWR